MRSCPPSPAALALLVSAALISGACSGAGEARRSDEPPARGAAWAARAEAEETWILAEQPARRAVPVIVNPWQDGPGSFDQLHARPDNATILAGAGVPVILSTFSSHNARNLGQIAGNAVRCGMSREAALRAITRTPADAFGMTAHGRLAPGARASVVLWSGDAFELSSFARAVWIVGRAVPMESRQTLLLKRYRELPGTLSPPLPLPSGP